MCPFCPGVIAVAFAIATAVKQEIIMSVKKYNHYIPKFYLANFSGSSRFIDKCILSTGNIIRGASTKSTGGQDYLYGEDGKIEDIFSQLEGKWADVIRNIISSESIPSVPEDYEYLLHFIILSENRTLAKANSNLEFWGEQYRVMARMLKEQGKIVIPDEVIDSLGAECSIPNLQSIQHDIFLMNICADLQISLIKNISDLPFISSDHPVVKYNQLLISRGYAHGYGYGQMGIQIFFPISPCLCLVMFDSVPYRLHNFYDGKFIVKDPKTIQAINTLVAGYASQELYFSRETSARTVEKIVRRRIPDALTPSTGSLRMGTGYMVMMADPSYVHKVDIPLFSVIKPFRDIPISRYSSPPLRPHAEKIREQDEARDRRLEEDFAING